MNALRPYEILVIVDPRPSDQEVATLLTQLEEQLRTLGADVTKVDNWGKRRLAYEIKKQREGTYVVLEVSTEPPVVKEFERQLKLNEHVLRFLSTRVPVRKKKSRGGQGPAEPAPPPTEAPEVLEEVG